MPVTGGDSVCALVAAVVCAWSAAGSLVAWPPPARPTRRRRCRSRDTATATATAWASGAPSATPWAGPATSSILDHFYGGTSLAGLSSGQERHQVRVALTENDGNTVIVTSGSPFSVAGTSIDVPGGQAVFMNPVGSGVAGVHRPGLRGAVVAASHPRPIPPPCPTPTPASETRTRAPRPSSCARSEGT